MRSGLDGLTTPAGGLANLGHTAVLDRCRWITEGVSVYHLVHWHRAVREGDGTEDYAKGVVSAVEPWSVILSQKAQLLEPYEVDRFLLLYDSRSCSIVGATFWEAFCEVFWAGLLVLLIFRRGGWRGAKERRVARAQELHIQDSEAGVRRTKARSSDEGVFMVVACAVAKLLLSRW